MLHPCLIPKIASGAGSRWEERFGSYAHMRISLFCQHTKPMVFFFFWGSHCRWKLANNSYGQGTTIHTHGAMAQSLGPSSSMTMMMTHRVWQSSNDANHSFQKERVGCLSFCTKFLLQARGCRKNNSDTPWGRDHPRIKCKGVWPRHHRSIFPASHAPLVNIFPLSGALFRIVLQGPNTWKLIIDCLAIWSLNSARFW